MEKKAVLTIKGFKFAGVYCGIKENPNKKDISLIYSEVPASFAASFTTNSVKAPPVQIGLETFKKKKQARAILINSGNANACTGSTGLKNAREMVALLADKMNLKKDEVYVCSTGKIGIQLPMEKIKNGISKLVQELGEEKLEFAAQGILTTDRFLKMKQIEGKVGKTKYSLVGFAKGAGMIEPAMTPTGNRTKHATMLAYFLTDLAISSSLLQKIFNRVMDATFNRVTVDGDMSTNDTAMIMANGLAGNPVVEKEGKESKKFEKELEEVAQFLALQLLEDGEGSTKVVELIVKGAKTEADAREVAYRVGRSPLVKTAFFGEDPNWGRLLAAIGYSGVAVESGKIQIDYEKVPVVKKGEGVGKEAEKKAHEIMKSPRFTVSIDLKQGKSKFRIWTSDLTVDYVKLNAEYRT